MSTVQSFSNVPVSSVSAARDRGKGSGFFVDLCDVLFRIVFSVWFGAMICFSALVAPSAFKVLPTRHLAGTIVNSVLGKVEWVSLVACLMLAVLAAAFVAGRAAWGTWAGKLAVVLPLVGAVDAAVSKWVVSAKLAGLRAMMNVPIDSLPETNPLRMEFNDFHKYSVWLMGANIILAIVLVVAQKKAGGGSFRTGVSPE